MTRRSCPRAWPRPRRSQESRRVRHLRARTMAHPMAAPTPRPQPACLPPLPLSPLSAAAVFVAARPPRRCHSKTGTGRRVRRAHHAALTIPARRRSRLRGGATPTAPSYRVPRPVPDPSAHRQARPRCRWQQRHHQHLPSWRAVAVGLRRQQDAEDAEDAEAEQAWPVASLARSIIRQTSPPSLTGTTG